ncbi:MAG: Lrp/AsnC ligand binding domain-containing protein [Candidatus Woesearchaeota archaeon]
MSDFQKKDLVIIAHLRQNARMKLTAMSRKTALPVSTIYDRLQLHEGKTILKHSSLIDFSRLGFSARVNVLFKLGKTDKQEFVAFLSKHQNVNSLYRINNGFDFLAECIFKNIRELEDFFEQLDARFDIKHKEVYHVIDELKREAFLSDPQLIELAGIEAA